MKFIKWGREKKTWEIVEKVVEKRSLTGVKWEEEMKEVGEGAAMAEMRKGRGRATSSLLVCWFVGRKRYVGEKEGINGD